MGSDGQQIDSGAVSRGLSLVYSEICMFKQIYTKIQSICSLKKSENDLRDLIIIVSIMFTKKAMDMAINSLLHCRYNCQVKHHCSNNFVPHLESDIVENRDAFHGGFHHFGQNL